MLSDYVREQLRWRESKAESFPQDKGNRQSVDALRSLADYVEGLEADPGGEQWASLERLQPHRDQETGNYGGTRAARELSRYGYGYGVTAGSHAELLTDLWTACMEDAYETAIGYLGSEDDTGTLTLAELGAARHELALPPSHWRRRSKATEAELAAEVRELYLIAAATDALHQNTAQDGYVYAHPNAADYREVMRWWVVEENGADDEDFAEVFAKMEQLRGGKIVDGPVTVDMLAEHLSK
jgi:hypothetical protein